MAEYILTTPTAVPVGSAVPFTETVVKGCCNIKHRAGSGIVTVKGHDCGTRYRVAFHGNVTGVAGAIQLGIYLNGEELPETEMSVVPGTAGAVWSVDAETVIPNCCEDYSVSVRVKTGATVTVNTAALIVDKEA